MFFSKRNSDMTARLLSDRRTVEVLGCRGNLKGYLKKEFDRLKKKYSPENCSEVYPAVREASKSVRVIVESTYSDTRRMLFD
jgi:hypothetical protein